VFACRGLLTGLLIRGQGGGFAFGACSQVLGYSGLDHISHRGIMVAHISKSKTAPITAVGLSQFGRRQAVHGALCFPLCLSSEGGASPCATRVARKLAEDLWAVRGKRAWLLLPVR